MTDRTIDIGYVHVGRPDSTTDKWVCADNCPHPDHQKEDTADD